MGPRRVTQATFPLSSWVVGQQSAHSAKPRERAAPLSPPPSLSLLARTHRSEPSSSYRVRDELDPDRSRLDQSREARDSFPKSIAPVPYKKPAALLFPFSSRKPHSFEPQLPQPYPPPLEPAAELESVVPHIYHVRKSCDELCFATAMP